MARTAEELQRLLDEQKRIEAEKQGLQISPVTPEEQAEIDRAAGKLEITPLGKEVNSDTSPFKSEIDATKIKPTPLIENYGIPNAENDQLKMVNALGDVQKQIMDKSFVGPKPTNSIDKRLQEDTPDTSISKSVTSPNIQDITRTPANKLISKTSATPEVPAATGSSVPEAKKERSIEEILDQAREDRRQMLIAQKFAEAGHYLGAGIGGTQVNKDYLEGLSKSTKEQMDLLPTLSELDKLKDYKLKAVMDDPNSDISKFYRNALMKKNEKLFKDFPAFNSMSAAQLEKAGLKLPNKDNEEYMALQWATLRQREKEYNEYKKPLGQSLMNYRENQIKERNELTPEQQKELISLDSQINKLSDIEKLKPGMDTGTLAGPIKDIRRFFNVDDPKDTAWKAKLGRNLSEYIKNMTGLTASDKERIALQASYINDNLSDDSFIQILRDIRKELLDTRNITVNTWATTKNISGLEKPVSPNQPIQSQSSSTPTQSTKDPKIQQYADQYKLDYNKASEILIKRGYKPNGQ